MNAFFFWLFSVAMIVSGLAVVLGRNPVSSLLCFVVSITCMSGLFVMLNAFFLAVIELLVTAGAVMVLFLFVIMLLDLGTEEHIPRRKVWMGCSLVLSLFLVYIIARMLDTTPFGTTTMAQAPAPIELSDSQNAALSVAHPGASQSFIDDFNDDTHRIGYVLFRTSSDPDQTSYVAPFEITSLLILVATIGVIVLCKQEERRPRSHDAQTTPYTERPKETSLTR